MTHRLKAAFIHLGVSSMIIGLFLWLVFFRWYPQPYDRLLGVWDALIIVLLVDIVLGPLLTLVVFNIAKPFKELRRDLAVIIFIQLLALGWGVHITYSMRPVINLFAINQFYLLSYKEYSTIEGADKFLPGIFDKPRLAYSVIGTQGQKKYDGVISAIMEGNEDEGLFMNPAKYLPFEQNIDQVKKQALSYQQLLSYNLATEDMMQNFLKQHGGQADDYVYFSEVVGNKHAILVMNQALDKIVGAH